MAPTGGRERPAFFRRRLGLATAALALSLTALGDVTDRLVSPVAAAPTRSGRVPLIYHKSRNFRIPFNVDEADRPRLKEVQLWVSDDSGFSWKTVSRTTADKPAFTFRATRDAEFWFAVRTLDAKGNLFPGANDKVEPSMKVVVDTTPPSLVIEPDGRRGSLAAVRWEVRDPNLDLKSLVLEYQVEGGRDWRVVPIRRPSLIGSESWDAGTAEPLKVRASVADKAGNVTEAMLSLSDGTPANPSIAGNEPPDFANPPPVSPISSGPNFTSDDPAPPRRGRNGMASAAPPALPEGDPFATPGGAAPTAPAASASAGAPNAAPMAPAPANVFGPSTADPFGTPPANAAANTAAATPPADAPAQTIVVGSPRFPLQYEVQDAGPTGPASVELWVTQDGGRTWYRRGEDPDRASPFQVDLGGEGTFGLRIVSRGRSGLGDQPPINGDPPHIWVEVDRTAPSVQLFPVIVGQGAHLGKVAIMWRASDVHLAASPVVLSWRPADQPGARWEPITEQPIENQDGKFIWTVPPTVPPRFHVRVDVVDTAGNRGSADTSDIGPIVVDRARPRSRIIGLDPSARGGGGPDARPLR